MICTHTDGGAKATCTGDSGEPLQYSREDGRFEASFSKFECNFFSSEMTFSSSQLIGVTSFGLDGKNAKGQVMDCNTNYPDVYARINDAAMGWIRETGAPGIQLCH